MRYGVRYSITSKRNRVRNWSTGEVFAGSFRSSGDYFARRDRKSHSQKGPMVVFRTPEACTLLDVRASLQDTLPAYAEKLARSP